MAGYGIKLIPQLVKRRGHNRVICPRLGERFTDHDDVAPVGDSVRFQFLDPLSSLIEFIFRLVQFVLIVSPIKQRDNRAA